MFFHVTEEGWVRRRGKGEWGCGEISFRIVFQNHIPFSLALFLSNYVATRVLFLATVFNSGATL